MSVRYTRVGWQDAPSTDTPIDAANLNHMDNAILALSEEVDTELPLLRDQINDISADIDTQIDEKVPTEVSSWLIEHVTPAGSAVVVDDSLTIQGAAADAKKTGDEISDLKDGLTAVESDVTDLKEEFENITGNEIIKFIKGGYINTSGSTVDVTAIIPHNTFSYAVVDCESGEYFTISASGSSSARALCFIDDDGNVLLKSDSGQTLTDYVVVAPFNSKKLILNSNNIQPCFTGKPVANKINSLISTANSQKIYFDFYRDCYIGADGSVVASTGSYATDYIEVNPGDTIYILNGYYSWARSICLYDENKDFLEYIFGNVSDTSIIFAITNTQAKYLRSTFRNPSSFSIGKLLNDLELVRTTLPEYYYEKGSFSSSGEPVTNSNFVRCKCFVDKKVNAIYIKGDYWLGLITYNTIGTFVSRSYWHGDDKGRVINLDHSQYKYKVYIRQKTQSATITTSDASANIIYQVSLDYYNKELENARLMINRSFDIGLANADNPMPLVTYYGDNQIVHPKVLYFPNKFGGHKYWMAYTPYPGGAVAYENPCIAYSDDGYGWENINGNPITAQPEPGSLTKYNSDTHLVYRSDTGKLECWYRYVEEGSFESIRRKVSTDGVVWGEEETLYTITSNASQLLSPAVFYESNTYKIWCVSKNNGEHIDYYESTDGTDWQFVRSIALSYVHDGEQYYPWHLDCIKDNGKYVMLIMCKGNTGIQWPLFLAVSSDNITYNTPYAVMLGSDAGWDTDMYRSSIINVDGTYRIYYSARKHSSATGYKYGTSISTSPVLKHFKGTQEYN